MRLSVVKGNAQHPTFSLGNQESRLRAKRHDFA